MEYTENWNKSTEHSFKQFDEPKNEKKIINPLETVFLKKKINKHKNTKVF